MNKPATSVETAAARRSGALVLLALLTVYIVSGSTYLGIKIALESYPPFGLGAIRFTAAGLVLFAWLAFRGTPMPTMRQWKNAAITGTLLLGGGNGLVCFAETSVSSSLAAVAVASMPL